MNNPYLTRIASTGLLIILFLFVLFHLLILTGVVPFDAVWGGRLKDREQMLAFESVSILMNLVMLAVVSTHAGVLRVNINRRLVKALLWGMFLLFLLNTIGNAFSTNELEKGIFTPLTLLMAFFSLVLARSKGEASTSANMKE
ncbi:hypothetical protein [Pontibacter litorisediminis]|uniref:hypothetical protein n=1 Tax=Pontibacter litorisediminis TaxID=1846260 RepID=UPI0023EDAF04|nr:hypothetical protein [Pontibacter litorisediminis]